MLDYLLNNKLKDTRFYNYDYRIAGERVTKDGFTTDSDYEKQNVGQILADATQFLMDKGVPVSVDTWVNSGNKELNTEAVKVLSKAVDIHAVDDNGKSFFFLCL